MIWQLVYITFTLWSPIGEDSYHKQILAEYYSKDDCKVAAEYRELPPFNPHKPNEPYYVCNRIK